MSSANEHPDEHPMNDVDDEYGDFSERRNRRIRMTAWITIIALIVGGGGASLATLFFGS